MNSISEVDAVGPAFSDDGMLEARNKTMEAVDAIAEVMQPGMTEDEGERAARKVLKSMGLLVGWHKICIRFGCNTTLEYGIPSTPGVTLGENDIFTIDIGPLWKGWEGDGGNTFVLGNDPEMLRAKNDVKALWEKIHNIWRDVGVSGKELYKIAADEADKMGWIFNPVMAGHRVSDFPHPYQGKLSEVETLPTANRWILEILIRHKKLPFGAYYEDLMISN